MTDEDNDSIPEDTDDPDDPDDPMADAQPSPRCVDPNSKIIVYLLAVLSTASTRKHRNPRGAHASAVYYV